MLRIFILIVMQFIIITSAFAAEMSELDKAYKEQHDKYVS